MEPRIVRANEKVEADHGRIAVERGPVVYCAEWPDNGFSVRSLMMVKDPGLAVSTGDVLGHRVEKISSIAQSLSYDKLGRLVVKDVRLTMIPYYAWCHRGSGEMMFWLPQKVQAVIPSSPNN